MEAIIAMISWHYKTMKMGNNSKTKHVENNNNNNTNTTTTNNNK